MRDKKTLGTTPKCFTEQRYLLLWGDPQVVDLKFGVFGTPEWRCQEALPWPVQPKVVWQLLLGAHLGGKSHVSFMEERLQGVSVCGVIMLPLAKAYPRGRSGGILTDPSQSSTHSTMSRLWTPSCSKANVVTLFLFPPFSKYFLSTYCNSNVKTTIY